MDESEPRQLLYSGEVIGFHVLLGQSSPPARVGSDVEVMIFLRIVYVIIMQRRRIVYLE